MKKRQETIGKEQERLPSFTRRGAEGGVVKCLLHFSIVLGLSLPTFSQGSVLSFVYENKVHLRWTTDASANHDGYNVYRGSAGSWTKLNSTLIKPVLNVAEIRTKARYKADMYLSLFGADAKATEITKSTFTQRLGNAESGPLIGAICMVNPEFGELLGVRFTDVSPSGTAQYRVTTVRGGSESDWATTGSINSTSGDNVPMAEALTLTCGDAQVELKWKKDNELMKSGAIVSYHVYRATNLLGPYERIDYTGILPVTVSSGTQKTDPNIQAFSDQYLTNGTTYYYYITAMNAFGFESLPSSTVNCTPQAGGSAGQTLSAELVGKLVKVSWNSKAEDARSFAVYRAAGATKTFSRVMPAKPPAADMSWYDTDVSEGNTYRYYVVSTAENGSTISSDTIEFIYPDQTPPAAPTGVKAAIENGQIVIRWTRNTEKDLAGFEVERASDKEYKELFRMTPAMITVNYYTDNAPQQSPARYGYVVYAFDNSNNKSAPSTMVFARMPDKTPPQAPIITGTRVDSSVVKVTWTSNIEDDFAKYRLWRYEKDPLKKILLREPRETTAYDKPPKDGTYNYIVAAVDSTGNESKPSQPVGVTVVTETEVPTPIKFTVTKQEDDLLLAWQCVETNTLAGFVITRENLKTGEAVMVAQLEDPNVRTITDGNADVEANYTYTIQAFDKDWRMSDEVKVSYRPE